MPKPDNTRIVLLNRLIARSISRGPEEHKPPIHGVRDLLSILQARAKAKNAIEFMNGARELAIEEDARLLAGKDSNSIRLSHFKKVRKGSAEYAVMLLEHVDQSAESFPVVSVDTFNGRELSGESDERGGTSCHVLVKLPVEGEFDDGSYRCVLEYIPPISRKMIERFLSNQLRREAHQEKYDFNVFVLDKKRNVNVEKTYKYYPVLQLHSDVGRSMKGSWTAQKKLVSMLFTKRNERPSAGVQTELSHDDVIGDVQFKVDLKTGPQEPTALTKWATRVRNTFSKNGYSERLYYRHINGSYVSGSVESSMEGAADLLMCHKDFLQLPGPRKHWSPCIVDEIVKEMIKKIETDELWRHP